MEYPGKTFHWTCFWNTQFCQVIYWSLGIKLWRRVSAEDCQVCRYNGRNFGKCDNADCKVSRQDKNRSSTDPTEAIKQVVADLLSSNVFVYTPGRDGYSSFPKISANLVHRLDYRDLYNSMKTRLNEWAKIYEHWVDRTQFSIIYIYAVSPLCAST